MTSSEVSSSEPLSAEPLSAVAAGDRRSGPARWLVAGSLGVLLLGGGFVMWRLFAARTAGGAMQFPPGVPVTLAAVQAGSIQDSSEFIGSLEAQAAVVLQPEVSGRVAEVYVAAGDRVTAGTPILLINPDRTEAELNAAQATVIAARAAQTSAQARLRALEARRAELEADLALEEENYRRISYLVGEGALSEQDLDIASRDRAVARAALASAREEIAASRASLSESEATLQQVEATRAAVQQDLQDRLVVAPIDGIVGDLSVKLGDYVTPSVVIANITENSVLELSLEVPIEQRTRLRLGLPVELLAVGSGETLTRGSVTFISPQANATAQTVLIKARFSNGGGQLQDAQRVDARIVWAEQPGVLVPTSAIARLGGQTFVYIADEGTAEELPPPEALPPGMPPITQVARLRPVQLGSIQDNNYQILDGIRPGETIVVAGILNLQDGTPILPQSGEAPPDQAPPQ